MPDALRDAFDQHYVSLLKLATALTGRRETAEDVVQDAFVRSAAHLERLPSEAVRPYLRRTVVNLWRNRLRRLAVELRHLGRDDGSAPSTTSADDRDAVWRALRRLPPRQRACLVLRYYEDLSEREIADVLGCAPGTVKSQTSRGLAKLREWLDDD